MAITINSDEKQAMSTMRIERSRRDLFISNMLKRIQPNFRFSRWFDDGFLVFSRNIFLVSGADLLFLNTFNLLSRLRLAFGVVLGRVMA